MLLYFLYDMKLQIEFYFKFWTQIEDHGTYIKLHCDFNTLDSRTTGLTLRNQIQFN